MQRYFFEIAYNGTNYAGWQKQPNAETVQETIEMYISRLYSNKEINILGCGRTDAGVHARQFYFHVDLEEKYELVELKYKLNNMLPYDISVNSVHKTGPEAHARFDATERTYRYRLHQSKDPFKHMSSWYFSKELDIESMNTASKLLIGKKDFTSFSKLHTDVKTNICDLTHAIWKESNDQDIHFEITANRFLRNMVRAIVGTLLEVGLGSIKPIEVENIIQAKDRGEAGISVPAHGLYLTGVKYPFL